MIQKKMVNCLEQSIELAVGKTKLANNVDIIKAFFKATNIENQSIITNEFVCSAHNLNCNEKVIMWVPMSFFYAAQDKCPTHNMDVLCFAVCWKPACETEAKQQTEMLIKSTSKLFSDFRDGQRRHSGNCRNMSLKKFDYMKRSLFMVVFN